MTKALHRIVAHRDFDGLISALLLQELLGIEEVVFYDHGEEFTFTGADAVVDLPYPPGGCGLWIDHHAGSAPAGPDRHHDPGAPSCPHVIVAVYGMGRIAQYSGLIAAADRIDSARFTAEELRHPDAALQIAMTIPHAAPHYLEFLLQQLRQHDPATVASSRVVQERYARVAAQQEAALASALSRRGNVLLLETDTAPPYLAPLLSLSHDVPLFLIISKAGGERLRIMVAENLFNPLNAVHLGMLMQEYGGGGHKAAAGCTIPAAEKQDILDRLLARLNQ